MRISTSVLFDTGTARITEMQSNLAKVQTQISTGRRVLTPADDPVGASQALVVSQSQAANEQLSTNRRNAKNSLEQEEGALQGVTGLLQTAKTLIVAAGNGALDNQQRAFYATELGGILDEMIGLANTQDGNGNYLFSGFQSTVLPYSKTATGAQFGGDQGQRMMQVGPSRQLAAGDSGANIFDKNKTGNGIFTTGAAVANTGSGVASTGSVVNSAALTGNNYRLDFTVAAGVTTYAIVNTTTAATLSAGNAYTSGQAITFDGLQFDVSGAPANGDQFTVVPASNQSIFTTLTNLITVLSTPVSEPVGKANLVKGLSDANGNLSNALDNVLTVRASVGIRLKEVDTLDSQGDDMNLQYSQQLEELQGLDYAKAISDLSKQKVMLEAAQQSFVKTVNLSLFNFI
jgi:flagellar hook-associated protein 3 FlgL